MPCQRKSWCPDVNPCKFCEDYMNSNRFHKACFLRPHELKRKRTSKEKKDSNLPKEEKQEEKKCKIAPKSVTLPFSYDAFDNEDFMELFHICTAFKTIESFAKILHDRLQGGTRKNGRMFLGYANQVVMRKIIGIQGNSIKKRTTSHKVKCDFDTLKVTREFYYFKNVMPDFHTPNWWIRYHNERIRSRFFDITLIYNKDGRVEVMYQFLTEQFLAKEGFWQRTV